MGYLITDIIQWAKISQPLAAQDQAKKLNTRGGSIIQDLDVKLYVERKSLEYAYAQDPTGDETFQIGQWVLSLLGMYLFKAQQATGGGGSITPVTPVTNFAFDYLIPVYGGVPDFTNATDYDDSRIVGHNLEIFWNDVPKFLAAGEWAYTVTGIRFLIGGFDATVNTYDVKIFIRDPFGASGTGVEVTRLFQFTGTTGSETSITAVTLSDAYILSVTRGTPYTIINTGSPVGTEALVTPNANNLCNGTIDFDATNPIAVGEVVSITFSKSI